MTPCPGNVIFILKNPKLALFRPKIRWIWVVLQSKLADPYVLVFRSKWLNDSTDLNGSSDSTYSNSSNDSDRLSNRLSQSSKILLFCYVIFIKLLIFKQKQNAVIRLFAKCSVISFSSLLYNKEHKRYSHASFFIPLVVMLIVGLSTRSLTKKVWILWSV